MDTTGFLAAIDWSAVITGVAAVATLLLGPKVAKFGFRKLLSMIPG